MGFRAEYYSEKTSQQQGKRPKKCDNENKNKNLLNRICRTGVAVRRTVMLEPMLIMGRISWCKIPSVVFVCIEKSYICSGGRFDADDNK